MRKLFQNNQGSTLPVVLTVFFIVIIFSVTALTIGSASSKQAENQELRLQAYYLARSGASAVASYIVNNPDKLSEAQMNTFISKLLAAGTSEPFKLDPDDKGEIKVSVTKPSEDLLVISSTAGIRGISRTVSVEISVQKETGTVYQLDKAVYTTGDLILNNKAKIIGPVAISGNISMDSKSSITGTLFIEPDMNPSTIPDANLYGNPKIANLTEELNFPELEFPAFPAGTPQSSYTLSSDIKISGNDDIIIFTKKLNLSGNVSVLRDSGKKGVLKIFVTEEININGSLAAEPELVHIYYKGDYIHANGNRKISATFYAEKAKLNANGNFDFTGFLFYWGSDITLGGSATFTDALVYAPKAVVFLNNNNDHSGCIIAKILNMKGGSLELKPFGLPMGEGPGSGSSETKTTYSLVRWQ